VFSLLPRGRALCIFCRNVCEWDGDARSGRKRYPHATDDRWWPLLGNARRRDLVLRALEMTRAKYPIVVCGYVVMPEHVHLLVSEPGRQNLSAVINQGNGASSRAMAVEQLPLLRLR
jgi:hypothetical protein